MTLGELIKTARINKNMTTLDLSAKTNISQGYISKIELDQKRPSLSLLEALSTTLEIPYDELLILAGYLDKTKYAGLVQENVRLQELLEGNDGMSVKDIRNQFVNLHRDYLKVQSENKKLREQQAQMISDYQNDLEALAERNQINEKLRGQRAILRNALKNISYHTVPSEGAINLAETINEIIADRINQLLNDYDFPLPVLRDVRKRLSDSDCPHYAMQQLKYLENNVRAGIATKREETT